MNKRFQWVIAFICATIFSNCMHSHSIAQYDPSKEQFIKQSKLMYEKNIIDFFPEDCNSTFSMNDEWGSYYSSSWEDSSESKYRCCAYYSKKVSETTMDSLESIGYVERIKYDETSFTIDVPYMRHAESYHNAMKDSLQIPIANMRYSFFSLGEIVDTIVIGNRRYLERSEIIPGDLVVYVYAAQNGNFWKNKTRALEEQRPVLPDFWKHGYVKGIAVSHSLSRVCWWAMAW